MVRGRKKRRSDVYRTDFSRISVYPGFQRPSPQQGLKKFKSGDEIKVRVTGQDDDGRPTGMIKGFTVVLEGADVEPGAEVRAVITRVSGKTIYARPVE
ncbi:MAG: TRAM domain-containing protein [Desulfurococcales archaeon]|nr:TRAM domain-containing protein [Desulfurococcales archaeon]